ncbi:MAG TPA: histone-like nucleoid-structuring protein Lsr2, partial [Actinomycetaceae bacterium]|nr:histone-like nucleoid-structuring protein Lsr2 [Actinomycetaceae bacterium]
RSYDAKAVRKWAEANGIEVSARGRIPASILEQYQAAGN